MLNWVGSGVASASEKNGSELVRDSSNTGCVRRVLCCRGIAEISLRSNSHIGLFVWAPFVLTSADVPARLPTSTAQTIGVETGARTIGEDFRQLTPKQRFVKRFEGFVRLLLRRLQL